MALQAGVLRVGELSIHVCAILVVGINRATLAGSKHVCILPSPCEGFLDAPRPGPSCRSALRATHRQTEGETMGEQPAVSLLHSVPTFVTFALCIGL